LRHTFATELANSDVSVYTLMKLLGHQSMVTAQRYVTAAGTETARRSTEQALPASNRRLRNVKAGTLPDRWIRIAILLAAVVELDAPRRAAKYLGAQCIPQHNRYYVR
jgi:Phage integrase family